MPLTLGHTHYLAPDEIISIFIFTSQLSKIKIAISYNNSINHSVPSFHSLHDNWIIFCISTKMIGSLNEKKKEMNNILHIEDV